MAGVPGTTPGAMVSPARRRFSIFVVLATLFLLYAGAEVKSREAGLSVPDWPLSYGMWWPPMVGNVFYEHGHRTIAAAVGLLTAMLAIWTARREPRRWMRTLAWCALGAVVLQGVLGGLTVLFLLPTPISMGHGTLAQIVLCLLAWLAYATSAEWHGTLPARDGPARLGRSFAAARLATIVVFIQLVLGAWMRHSEAGLAVPFFPVSDGGDWLPDPVDRLVVIHMLHRSFALVVLVAVSVAAFRARRLVPRHALALVWLVVAQAALGGAVVLVAKAPVPTSLHVVGGAGVLLLCWLLTLRTWRAARRPGPA